MPFEFTVTVPYVGWVVTEYVGAVLLVPLKFSDPVTAPVVVLGLPTDAVPAASVRGLLLRGVKMVVMAERKALRGFVLAVAAAGAVVDVSEV